MTSRRRWAQRAEAPADTPADPPADPDAVARNICLRALAMAPKSRAQLAELMASRAVPPDVAENVLARFTDVGLIDDAAFASMLVQSRHNGRGLARRAIADELRKKGVDAETSREAVDAIDDDEEAATARSLVDRKLPGMRGLTPEARTRRLVGMLARKGYSSGVAYRVVKEAVVDMGHHIDDEFHGLVETAND
ncbi:MAG: regulatory protein [Frankiaceae bacterium]|jgi:regulatory protein|nr:regulatory protein [Frankiaceae bacterium]